MDHSPLLNLTAKGTDEVAHRTHKLGIKLRSVLLLLSHPQTLEFTVQKSVLPKDDVIEAIETLRQEGFITLEGADPAIHYEVPGVADTPEASPVAGIPSAADFTLKDEIILPEARFLLIDFCVDCFGMQSEKLAEDIHNSKNISALRAAFKEVLTTVNAHKPEHLNTLREIVRAINETA